MINALMWLKFGELFRRSPANIAPVYVPITIFIIHHLKTELLKSLSHHNISALRST